MDRNARHNNGCLVFVSHLVSDDCSFDATKIRCSFFVPKFLRSPRYDYYRRVPDEVAVREISNDSNVVARAVEQNIIVVDCENDDEEEEEESDDDDVSSKLVSTSRQGVYCTWYLFLISFSMLSRENQLHH